MKKFFAGRMAEGKKDALERRFNEEEIKEIIELAEEIKRQK